MSSISRNFTNSEAAARRKLSERLQFLGQMSSTETAMFHQAAAAQYGLGITDMKTVSVLMQEGSMTAGQLAQRLSLTTGAVTSVLDRLEEKHLVRRATDPKDRRKVIVEANMATIAKGRNVYESMGRAFAELYSTYTTEELEFLVRYFEAAVEMTKEQIEKLHATKPAKRAAK